MGISRTPTGIVESIMALKDWEVHVAGLMMSDERNAFTNAMQFAMDPPVIETFQ